MSNFESIVLNNLVTSDEYMRKVVPFLKLDYFQDKTNKLVFQLIEEYSKKYNKPPTMSALMVDLANTTGVNEDTFKQAKELIQTFNAQVDCDFTWLVDQTEKFCKDKAIYNAIMESIKIIDNKGGQQQAGNIPKLLSDALAVSFDTHVGHNYLEDSDERFLFHRSKEYKIPFNLNYFNTITNGGLPRKTLNVALAGTGVGKTLFMCHCAADNFVQGLNVLYITLEMAEERIAERIDANLLDCTMDELKLIPKEVYDKKIQRVRDKTAGKLIIKEYPTATANAANFRHLINELKMKRNFVPDIIYIDYLNICTSSRIKNGANVNSYTYIKAIAEELRGLAVENNVPIISATQTNRAGYTSSDVGLEDTSESFGLPATADFMFALIKTEELASLNQILVKQLKNRYNDPGRCRRFVVGVDHAKMRLYDCEQSSQSDLLDGPEEDVSAFDNSKFGEEEHERSLPKSKFNRDRLKDFQ